jgi:4-hydroxybenzoate polyprenyltransferase/phosphoserine phosphatase
MPDAPRPGLLCVDLDGTLVATDTLDECLLCIARRSPQKLLKIPLWLLGGKAQFKERVAEAAAQDLCSLPYRPSVCEYIEARAAEGEEVVLATAANWRIAKQVAGECKFIQNVLASDEKTNLSGERKLTAIRDYAAGRPFDYMGDHVKDLKIWRAARNAIVVGKSARLAAKVAGAENVIQISSGTGGTAREWLRQLRVHQWSKNVLLLLPLVLAHKITSVPALVACLIAFIAFSCAASAVYLVNDLIDLPHDRSHPTKSKRPLARGAITIRQALGATVGLVGAAAVLSLAFLPLTFFAMVVGYWVMSFAYSLWLKQLAIVDILMLAGFYVYRILIGAVAVHVLVSVWLLAFSMFFFLSLGTIKRYADLLEAAGSGETGRAGRSYSTADLEFLRTLGLACGCVATLVLALYLNSAEIMQLYRRPTCLWLVCPLALYWILRAWLIASHGEMHDDPVIFALRDKASYVVAALTAGVILLATI